MIELPSPLTAHLRREGSVANASTGRARAACIKSRARPRRTAHALEFVEDAVALVQVAEAWAKMLVYVNGLHGPRLHVHVP